MQRCNGATAGLGYLEANVNCPSKSPPLSGWLVSALSISIGENGSFPLLTLTPTPITLMQLQNKQASRPLHLHTTMQPPSKITVYKCTRLNTYLWNKNQKEWHWTYSKKHEFLIMDKTTLFCCLFKWLHPQLPNTGKASTSHTERRKTKREERGLWLRQQHEGFRWIIFQLQ